MLWTARPRSKMLFRHESFQKLFVNYVTLFNNCFQCSERDWEWFKAIENSLRRFWTLRSLLKAGKLKLHLVTKLSSQKSCFEAAKLNQNSKLNVLQILKFELKISFFLLTQSLNFLPSKFPTGAEWFLSSSEAKRLRKNEFETSSLWMAYPHHSFHSRCE